MLPNILISELVDYQQFLGYYKHKYGKTVKPLNRRSKENISILIMCITKVWSTNKSSKRYYRPTIEIFH